MFRRVRILSIVSILGALLCSTASADPTPDEILTKARVAAGEDRHEEAIGYYLSAVRAKPSLRSDVAVELGHQYTWADMPDSAIGWYDYYLLGHPDDIEAKIGRARALAWSDRLDESVAYYRQIEPEAGERHSEVQLGMARVYVWQEDIGNAERVYRTVLAEDSTNVEARIGLAQMTNWSGRHRQAEAMYRDVLADEPDNTEALQGLAYAQAWQGMHDRAYETVGGDGATGDVAATAAEVGRRHRATGHHMYNYRDNTTDGDFNGLHNEIKWYPEHLTELGVSYTRGVFDQGGFPKITRDELLVLLHQRFTPLLALTARAGGQWNRFDPVVLPPATQPANDFDFFTWDLYATITPRDWLRFDVGNSRVAVDIPTPIFRNIHVTTTTIGADWRWSRRLNSIWGLRFSNFSDSNQRRIVSGQVDYTVPFELPLPWRNYFVLSGEASHWNTERETGNGYFSPLSYAQLATRLRFVTDIGRRTTLDVAGRIGSERENGNDWASVGAFEGSVSYRISGGVSLRAGYATSGSRLDSPDGFRAKTAFVSIDYLISQ